MIRSVTCFVFLAALAAQPAVAVPAGLGKLCAASTKAEVAKNYPAAISHMKDYEQRGGEPFFAALRLGWLYYSSGDFPAAQHCYGQAVELQPASINARLGVLNTAVVMKDVRRTAQAAAAVLKVEPTNYLALISLAGLHFAQKNYTQAAADYARILVNYPDDPDALSGAAWSALRAGDKATARSRFELMLGRNPDYPQAQDGFQQSGK